MSNVFCVSYDLRGDEADYSGLFSALQDCARWWHFLESTWLVVFDGTAEELWRRLEPFVQTRDRLLIIAVGRDSQGYLPQKAWDWISENVESVAEVR